MANRDIKGGGMVKVKWVKADGKIDEGLFAKRYDKLLARGLSERKVSEQLFEEGGRPCATSHALRQRYRKIMRRVAKEKEKEGSLPSDAFYFAEIALSQLTRIKKDDPCRKEELEKVVAYCQEQLKEPDLSKGGKKNDRQNFKNQ
jgi:hypothetical protein